MTDRELMQMALDALENNWLGTSRRGVMDSIRARLAQPEPEPVAWAKPDDLISDGYSHAFTAWNPAPGTIDTVPLYTAPPQREWQGLTPEEVKEISLANRPYVADMVVALEARLKEKNT